MKTTFAVQQARAKNQSLLPDRARRARPSSVVTEDQNSRKAMMKQTTSASGHFVTSMNASTTRALSPNEGL